jgi:hypothetical protein
LCVHGDDGVCFSLRCAQSGLEIYKTTISLHQTKRLLENLHFDLASVDIGMPVLRQHNDADENIIAGNHDGEGMKNSRSVMLIEDMLSQKEGRGGGSDGKDGGGRMVDRVMSILPDKICGISSIWVKRMLPASV